MTAKIEVAAGLRNWVEVDGAALRHNAREFRRRLAASTRLGVVVKSNAYGHGILETARIAVDEGCDWLCVNEASEGAALRSAGFRKPILVMGYVPLGELDAVVAHDLRPVVYNLETLERLQTLCEQAGKQVALHLKVETGTHRQGIPLDELEQFARRIDGSPQLRLDGLSTHFANIEDTTEHGFAEEQIARFQSAAASLREHHPELICHAACSAATLLFGRMHLDLARIGISFYGIWPSKETYLSCLERGTPTLDLRPALSWKTRVAQVKTVPEGSFIGYGCTYRMTRESRIAVLPVGYYEGDDRGLSGVGHVLIRGKRAPVRGRVCMNMCMVDVSDIPGAGLEDEVVLLGSQEGEHIAAAQIAAWLGTISYEVVARINPELRRIVTDSDAAS